MVSEIIRVNVGDSKVFKYSGEIIEEKESHIIIADWKVGNVYIQKNSIVTRQKIGGD